MKTLRTSYMSLIIAANLCATGALAAQQTVNIGTAPNDGTGDTLRGAFTKLNQNFSELYTRTGPIYSTVVNPLDAKWAGGADPTGVRDSGPAFAAATAAGNEKISLPCGTYLVNQVIYLKSYTEFAGDGKCVTIKPGPSMAANAQWAFVNLNAAYATIFSNADMQNGNTQISVHDLTVDISSTDTGGRRVWGLGFGNTTYVHIYNTRVLGIGSAGTNQDGIAFVQSSNYTIDHNYVYGTANTCYDQWNNVSNFNILYNECDGAHSGATGIFANGVGGPTGASLITPVDDAKIIGNTIKHVTTGMLLTGLCSTVVCGITRGMVVQDNILDDIYLFSGIIVGDGASDFIGGNKISNVYQSCISAQSQIPGGKGITYSHTIVNNTCENINLSGLNNSAISVGNGLDTPTNTTISGNNISSAIPQVSAQIEPYASTTLGTISGNTLTGVFSGTIIPGSGQILSGPGITGTPTILASAGTNTWTISGPSQGSIGPVAMAVSGQVVTGAVIAFPGYCLNVPTPVFTGGGGSGAAGTVTLSNGTTGNISTFTLTSGGNGYTSPPIITFSGCNPPQYQYATKVNGGAVGTTFVAGHEDPGSVATDLISGTQTPVTDYGVHTFPSQAEFTSQAGFGFEIANPNLSGYSQLLLTGVGTVRSYQIGVGNSGETSLGVAGCGYYYATNGANVIWRVCADGNFVVNPTKGVASAATLDVIGTGRVAPGSLATAGTCNAASEGKFATINDSSTSTPGATISGGGSLHVFGVCLNSSWTVH